MNGVGADTGEDAEARTTAPGAGTGMTGWAGAGYAGVESVAVATGCAGLGAETQPVESPRSMIDRASASRRIVVERLIMSDATFGC